MHAVPVSQILDRAPLPASSSAPVVRQSFYRVDGALMERIVLHPSLSPRAKLLAITLAGLARLRSPRGGALELAPDEVPRELRLAGGSRSSYFRARDELVRSGLLQVRSARRHAYDHAPARLCFVAERGEAILASPATTPTFTPAASGASAGPSVDADGHEDREARRSAWIEFVGRDDQIGTTVSRFGPQGRSALFHLLRDPAFSLSPYRDYLGVRLEPVDMGRIEVRLRSLRESFLAKATAPAAVPGAPAPAQRLAPKTVQLVAETLRLHLARRQHKLTTDAFYEHVRQICFAVTYGAYAQRPLLQAIGMCAGYVARHLGTAQAWKPPYYYVPARVRFDESGALIILQPEKRETSPSPSDGPSRVPPGRLH